MACRIRCRWRGKRREVGDGEPREKEARSGVL